MRHLGLSRAHGEVSSFVELGLCWAEPDGRESMVVVVVVMIMVTIRVIVRVRTVDLLAVVRLGRR